MSREEDKRITTDSYRKNAQIIADKFSKIPPHVPAIDRAFELCEHDNPSVLEIGFGGGRDAQYLIDSSEKYIGIDVSPEMVEIAKRDIPDGDFRTADIADFVFPSELDAIFAFASLHFLDRNELQDVLERATAALKSGGVIVMEQKKGEYARKVTEDGFGKRIFYSYNRQLLEDILPPELDIVACKETERRGQNWLTIIFKKR